MRSAKRYTNVTFTKRVDHDAGRHRPPHAPAEPMLCPSCGAVYAKRRWSHTLAARTLAGSAGRPFVHQLCASCRRRRSGVPHGFLHIAGDFFGLHRTDIEHLLRNEVARAGEDNPLHQILGWEDLKGGGLLVTTATEHLVQRLGRALEKAYDGDIHYGFSHENKLAHVWWHR